MIVKYKNYFIIIIIGIIVFGLSFLALVFGDFLAATYDVIGIRIATLFVAYASFISSMTFSFLIYYHNRTVSRINDDTNKRAELFRELQFASSNYSIIEFMDRMLIYNESERYVERLINTGNTSFHMFEEGINFDDVRKNPHNYRFISVRIPFRVVEGKLVSHISFDRLTFERDLIKFRFLTPDNQNESRVFILYNELTKRNNVIINLVVSKDSAFMQDHHDNYFTKIKVIINITSLLGVRVKGISELYFTNPEQIEFEGSNTYRINSSNFTLIEMPKIAQINDF